MSELSSFTDDIRRVADELREGNDTHGALNRASVAIDHLGRRLHGVGYLRGREIAGCLTEALGELETSHTIPEARRRAAVDRAVSRLQAALEHAAAGALPDPPDPRRGAG